MKTAILTLDIINDICHPKGKIARFPDRIREKGIIQKVNTLTAWGRVNENLIIHVRVGFRSSYLDCSVKSPLFSAAKKHRAVELKEWGGQFSDELKIEPNDVEVIKHRVSAFYGTDLDLILRANQIERIVLTGVATNNAVELTAREGHDRDYVIVVAEDTTECLNDEEQKASMNFLSRIATIFPIEEIMQ